MNHDKFLDTGLKDEAGLDIAVATGFVHNGQNGVK